MRPVLRLGASAVILLAVACAPTPLPRDEVLDRLAGDLLALPDADPAEAALLARTVLRETAALADRYRVRPPALLHNALVRLGLRDAGLCCHWTRDLLDRIEGLGLSSYRAAWGVAHLGSRLREHSGVVLTTNGQPFGEGIVLDAWRGAGVLAWAPVSRDRYPWRAHPEERPGVRIACR